MGEVFRPQTGQPSSFLDWLDKQRGVQLVPVFGAKVPTYEQERFEKQILQFVLTATSAGNIMQFDFDPPPPFPSFRLNWATLLSNTTTAEAWLCRAAKRAAVGVANITVARVFALPGLPVEIISAGGASGLTDAADRNSTWIGGAFNLYRNHLDDEVAGVRESFNIISESVLIAADTVQLMCEIEIIPDAAVVRQVRNLVTVSV